MQYIRSNGEDENSRADFAKQLEQLVLPNDNSHLQYGSSTG